MGKQIGTREKGLEGMFKQLSLVKKRPSISREEFAKFWISEFSGVAAQLTGLRKYTVNVTTPGSPEQEWDGFAEIWFDDRAAYEAAFAEPELGDRLEALRQEFIEIYVPYFVDESTIV